MNGDVTFLDCPAYLDAGGSVRCGLPAYVECRYLMESTDGSLESATIRCPAGHFFNGPIECLAVQKPAARAKQAMTGHRVRRGSRGR